MLTQPIQELIQRLEALRDESSLEDKTELAHETNALVSSAAAFYEKVRYLIDYREEHTIRRSAIERILKRRVLIEEGQSIDGEDLLKELVEGQYIPGEQMTSEAAEKATRIVERFLRLYDKSDGSAATGKKLLSFAATEIEQSFASKEREIDDAVVDALYKTVRPNASVAGLSSREVDMQLFCACRRALLTTDNDTLHYALWLLHVPQWKLEVTDPDTLAPKLSHILASIDADARNPIQWQLVQKIKNESIYFHIIRELIRLKGGSAELILARQSELDDFTKKFLAEKYQSEQARLQSSGARAVIYLFFTKFVAALTFELPYEVFILGGVHYVALLTNLLFHPVLLLVATRGVGRLNEDNTKAIIAGMRECLSKGRTKPVKIESSHNALTAVFATVYLMLIVGVFSGLIGILKALEFNVVSIALFLLFLAFVSYFAFRIRYNAQRWRVTDKEGAMSLIMHVLAVPVVRVGRWLSQTFSSINVFVLFMDFIIETPFKLLLSFSRQFVIYLREKANDVY